MKTRSLRQIAIVRAFILAMASLGLILISAVAKGNEKVLPELLSARMSIHQGGQLPLWEKTLEVSFSEPRRALATSGGYLDTRLVINHAAHPWLWAKLGAESIPYATAMTEAAAKRFKLPPHTVAHMETAADMDHLAVVTKSYGPLTVTVLATAGARSNAIRTGVDEGSYIEGWQPAGTINIIVMSNIELTDAALARALITVTEGKTAALQDLNVKSTYTPSALATGTGTDSIVVVSGKAAPRANYTGGHSRIGELIGKATYEAVVESLGKQNGFYLPGTFRVNERQVGFPKSQGDIRVALLHLAPVPGDVDGNRQRIEAAIQVAIRQGADWVLTPELAETGYNFAKRIGTDWIAPFPSAWVSRLSAIARDNRVALFVGLAERDALSKQLHNSVAVIDREGQVLGTYRKQRPVGQVEAWAKAGGAGQPFTVDGLTVGFLICADTWKPEPAADLAAKGAEILLVPANWPPVAGMGPGDVWEKRAGETGLPVLVANRTGKEPELDFALGESVVAWAGKRLFEFSSSEEKIFYIDWDRKNGFKRVY